ncbi:MAG: D-(-)-3-hydroxybutyrate oligomer hydrolase [Steroidobacteraceae bacterium]|nr:D-(-)-3-hydroxybutyrate oligomer hydrolase [Steroidobacteraceae bacterium]
MAACVVAIAAAPLPGRTPAAVTVIPVSRLVLDGRSDDLLTAGLGLEGLRAPAPPGFADATRPTPVELRRRAIWSNWRGLVDLSPDGGAGRLFGPRGAERIAGVERLGALRLPDAAGADAVLLQVPAAFDPRDPCLVAVASSGSRGIYGALPTAGEWGLRRGCAVVTTDKGTGSGFYDPAGRRGIRVDGTATTDPGDALAGFVPVPLPDVAADEAPWLLSKHAHSGTDPEPLWGLRLVEATRLAFAWLNEEYRGRLARPLAPANTRVIAAGISNGGAAVLRALELDRGPARARWFDGAVVAEPNVAVAAALPSLLLAAGGPRRELAVRGLLDYATLHGLLQPCAMLAEPDPAAPLAAVTAGGRATWEAWCADLAAHGEVGGAGAAAQAADARARLLATGIEPGALALGHVNVQSQLWLSIAATYVQAHGRARPEERPCGLAFAAQDAAGRPRRLDDAEWARLFADAVGIPPTAGIGIVRVDGAPAATPATLRCLRGLVQAALRGDAGATASPVAADLAARLRAGLDATQVRADPGARPVLLLHGRLDGLIPVNHSTRPYYAAASARAPRGALRYYEVAHGQHFDALLGLPGFAGAFVPMQPHLLAALDLMDAHLARGAVLPPSQVLRSRPRRAAPAGGLGPLDARHLGAIAPRPAAGDRIAVRAGVLQVPD